MKGPVDVKPPEKEAPGSSAWRNPDEILIEAYRALHGAQEAWHREAMRRLEVYQRTGDPRDKMRYDRHIFGEMWKGSQA